MEPTEKTTEPNSTQDNDAPVAPYTLLYLIRAYNRKEITFEEWLRLTKEWAERIISQSGKAK